MIVSLKKRKVISNGISHNYKLKEIAETLGFDPTSISKKVKRWLYVCTGYNKKYNNKCCFTKYKYDAQKAQNKADINLINSRKGINIVKKHFQKSIILLKPALKIKLL